MDCTSSYSTTGSPSSSPQRRAASCSTACSGSGCRPSAGAPCRASSRSKSTNTAPGTCACEVLGRPSGRSSRQRTSSTRTRGSSLRRSTSSAGVMRRGILPSCTSPRRNSSKHGEVRGLRGPDNGRMPENPAARAFATAQVQAGFTPGTRAEHRRAADLPVERLRVRVAAATRVTCSPSVATGTSTAAPRIPTVLVFEERVAALEDGIAAAGVASGQAAVALALLALAKQGEHIVAAKQLYGGTIDLLQDTFLDWGIAVTFVDQDDETALARGDPPGDARPLRRIGDQSARAGARRAGGRRHRPRRRGPARDRQHRGDAIPAAAEGASAPTSPCIRRRSSSAATARRSAGSSSTSAPSTSRAIPSGGRS